MYDIETERQTAGTIGIGNIKSEYSRLGQKICPSQQQHLRLYFEFHKNRSFGGRKYTLIIIISETSVK